MSVYRPFSRNDILFSTISTRPRVSVAFGSGSVWRGSAGISGSLSLYGGVRARRDVRQSDFVTSGLSVYPIDPLDTNSIDKVIFVSGSYPSTGSVRFVRCTDDAAPNFFTSITDVRWYEEHFRPVQLMYDFYSRLDSCYFTGSYDAYDVLLLADRGVATRPGSYFAFSGSADVNQDHLYDVVTDESNWTAEAWFKPLMTGSRPIIMSQPSVWAMGVGPRGEVVVYGQGGGRGLVETSSSIGSVVQGEWNHIAVVASGGQAPMDAYSLATAFTFYVNGTSVGSSSINIFRQVFEQDQAPLMVGAWIPTFASPPVSSSDGFVFETRLWNRTLTQAEIQQNLSGTLLASGSASGLLHYARFNDGPLSVEHGFAAGSGAFDYSPYHSGGFVQQYSNQHNVHWQPNDHETFIFKPNITGSLYDMRLFHLPSLFYGKQISPGSVRVTDGLYNNRKIVRVFNDDGRGSLYVSGSMTRDISGEEYRGSHRRKVGNVFYSEGIIVFTDPALWDMFDDTSALWNPVMSGTFPDLLALDFQGEGKIYTKTFNCRMPTAQVNASNNPTFSILDDRGTSELDDDVRLPVRDDGTTYVTSVGLYNEDKILVAVAKLAQPIRKREKDKINLRLKIDF